MFWKLKGRRCEIPEDEIRVNVSQIQPHNIDWIRLAVHTVRLWASSHIINTGNLLNIYVVSNITFVVERI
jgi:hypothetical protein